MRKHFIRATTTLLLIYLVSFWFFPALLWTLIATLPLILLGIYDLNQSHRTILRNFPVIGHFRYLLEMIRPEIFQYFIESDSNGRPISRERRSLVYQRAKRVTDTLPLGTKCNVYAPGYEWVNHSLSPTESKTINREFFIGQENSSHPYRASLLNVSAMSFGALSKTAIESLSHGAKLGGFALNTGEGGISQYHLVGGADIIWQIGTAYFGCRTQKGAFDPDRFAEKSAHPQVKLIELKLSQGAKPGHGGILPAKKLTPEIAVIRGVELGKDVVSPPGHQAFATPRELLLFVAKLRELSGGKPVGIKLCIGKRREFLALCKAMLAEGIVPDFITVDGGEGGTGAAPLEFSDSVGCPGREALIFVHNALVGFALRKKTKVIASAGVINGFDLVQRIALGADAVNSARGVMLALGCVQALRCNTNACPTGIATQNPELYEGLHIPSKAERVCNYHKATLDSAAELMAAMGIKNTEELRPWHIMHRIDLHVTKHYGELYHYLEEGDLLGSNPPQEYKRALSLASPDSFTVSI